MLNKGDFHIHSTASDGELTPEEIIIVAKERGIDIIAIADHNTTSGIEKAVKAGMKYGILVIPAVELSTRYNHEKVHLLGYFTDNQYNDNTFQEILKFISNHKVKKARKLMNKFMVTDTSGDRLSVMEGISLLKAFGSSVVLAHPVRIDEKYLERILNFSFDGIEARYCRNTSNDTDYFINMALERFSFYTAGSDFHTDKKEDTKHSLIGEPYLNQAEIQIFLKRSKALVFG